VTTRPGRADAPRRQGPAGWFDPRGRRLGGIAFALNRITGLGLVLYLYLHLVLLSQLALGADRWDSFVSLVSSPAFLAFDVVLLAGLLIHGLNGIRVALVGFGLGISRQRASFVVLMVVAALALVLGAARIFQG
jgi:succinate dehydrogenase / fumarate reductase cytochrome b subunit